MTASTYAELHCHSYFSLLDGASSPEDLVARAGELALAGLALTDHDSLAGAVRFWAAARRTGLHAILGAEVTLVNGAHLTLLAETQDGYANLCRLITASRRSTGDRNDAPQPQQAWAGKTAPALSQTQLAEHAGGLIALTGCRRGPLAGALLRGEAEAAYAAARQLAEIFGAGNLYVELQQHGLPDDDWLIRRLIALARRVHLPLVATCNAHYATPDRSLLRDVLIAVHHNTTLADAQRGGWLPRNSRYALAPPAEMARRFAQWPEALANTVAIAERCRVSLDFSAVRLPVFVGEINVTQRRKDAKVDGRNTVPIPQSPNLPLPPFQTLYDLCHTNLPRCYPTLQPTVISQLAHELAIIEQAGLAGYFLVVWDIVRFARSQGIRCQGRGSAANSIVAYLLGITSIDPLAHNLLFERFLSSDKFTMPDIDIDFAADRREEVIQYVYQKYGHDHTAMVCNVVTYRARSALRDLGKALDLPDEMIVRIQSRLDTNMPAEAAAQIEKLTMVNGQRSIVNCQLSMGDGQPATVNGQQAPVNEEGGEKERQLTIDHLLPLLLHQIDGCPRHLSIHSGGMLITAAPLATIVPLEPATMPDRVVCQWDKESVEDAGLIEIDLLSLRTLGMVSEALEHIAAQGQPIPDLDRLPLDDPEIYGLLHRGDTIGAFQVESRAQQQMLPRLKPVCFEDIAVEVAIVRPGPIQGGAVHPYLRRRSGLEPVSYLHPSLEPVLAESLGVLLFQEQAIRISVAAAGFAPGEADMLRRALSRDRSHAEMAAMRGRFVRGAAENGIDAATAAAIFAQLAGFAGYGFCNLYSYSNFFPFPVHPTSSAGYQRECFFAPKYQF